MKFSITSTAVALGFLASSAVAQNNIDEPDVFIDMEGHFSAVNSTPYVVIETGHQNWSLNWASVRDLLKQGSNEIPKEALVEACEALQRFRTEETGVFREYNIDPQTSLPPSGYKCDGP